MASNILKYSMTSDRVCALNGDDEENPDLDYYDDEDDLEAFSDADLGCEDGGTRVFPCQGRTQAGRARGFKTCCTNIVGMLYLYSYYSDMINN